MDRRLGGARGERMPQHSHRLISTTKKPDCEVLVFKRGRYTSECTVRRLEFSTLLEIFGYDKKPYKP